MPVPQVGAGGLALEAWHCGEGWAGHVLGVLCSAGARALLLLILPPSPGRCFDGCVFLVTGFGDAPDEKRAVLRALREGGATVADAVPDPPAAQVG